MVCVDMQRYKSLNSWFQNLMFSGSYLPELTVIL